MSETTYWSIYKKRLDILGPIVREIIKEDLKCPIVDIETLVDIETDVVCVGIIRALNMEIPSILEEKPSYKMPDYSYYETNDMIGKDTIYILEDMSGTVKLKLENITDIDYVPGCVVGIMGHIENNELVQKRVIHPTIVWKRDNQIEEDGPITKINDDENVIFINELNVDEPNTIGLMSILIDNLKQDIYGKIKEIVILGTVIKQFTENRYTTLLVNEENADIDMIGKKLQRTSHNKNFIENIGIIDQIFVRILSKGISIIILPGIEDPTSVSLPQMGIPRKFFPEAAKYDTFRTAQSPTIYHIRKQGDEMSILLDNGITYKFLKRVLPKHTSDQRIQIWHKSSHLLPMVPAVAWGSPFSDESNLILKRSPQLILTADEVGIESIKSILTPESEENTQQKKKYVKEQSLDLTSSHLFLPSLVKNKSFVIFSPINNELTTFIITDKE